jgi:thiamine biosynthesis protein ThiI
MLLLTLSSEIHIKSPRTRSRFIRILADNLKSRLRVEAPEAKLHKTWNRITIDGGDLDAAAKAASETFGVQRVEKIRLIGNGHLDEMSLAVADAARERIRGKKFAVRVRRRGRHAWNSLEAERLIGSHLFADSAGVDLTHPQVTVRVYVLQNEAYLVDDVRQGPDGLPLGVQGRALTLISGGFDSAVAAWMIMRRGVPMDFLHFSLDCAQSEHATAVTYELVKRWGHGSRSLFHMIDFQPVKEALLESVDSSLRQVVLKQFMVAAAEIVLKAFDTLILVTGESVGQVSSQTMDHLAAIDRFCSSPILRPLAGLSKLEIIERSRIVGTHNLSARAKEVCDLSDGPVAVAARPWELNKAHSALPAGLISAVLASWRLIDIADWEPGHPMAPVLREAPAGYAVIRAGKDDPPDGGPVALAGAKAPWHASRLLRAGREVCVIHKDLPPDQPGRPASTPTPLQV